MTTQPAIQLPLGQLARPPAFVSFCAEVVPQTSEALLNAMTNLVNQGFKEVHLLLSSPGGIVALGITISLLSGLTRWHCLQIVAG